MDHQEKRVFPVSRENLVSLGKMEGQDYQDPKVKPTSTHI